MIVSEQQMMLGIISGCAWFLTSRFCCDPGNAIDPEAITVKGKTFLNAGIIQKLIEI